MTQMGVEYGPRILNGLYGGTRSACYWVTTFDVQFGWIPDPPASVRNKSAKEPGSRKSKIAGYDTTQVLKKDSCTQDVVVSPAGHYFRTFIDPGRAPKSGTACDTASDVSKVIVLTLKSLR